MQNAMNNMVNNQLQNEFQLASITSNTPCSFSSSPSSSSPCPGLTVGPQAPAMPTAPSPSLPTQSPPALTSSPPTCSSPGVDTTIAAITRAHRETFIYAHDKLGPALLPHKGELDNQSSNRCMAGYHLNGHNTIYHHDNNIADHCNNMEVSPENGLHFQAPGQHQQHNNNGQQTPNSNLFGIHHSQEMNSSSQGQNCPWKKRKEILLVWSLIFKPLYRWLPSKEDLEVTMMIPFLQACPMNMHPYSDPNKTPQEIWEDFSLSFTPAVREVVEFAKHIPGFSTLSQNDQVTLLKAGTFEVSYWCFSSNSANYSLMVLLSACLFLNISCRSSWCASPLCLT